MKLKVKTLLVVKDKKFEKYINNYLNDKTGVVPLEKVLEGIRKKRSIKKKKQKNQSSPKHL